MTFYLKNNPYQSEAQREKDSGLTQVQSYNNYEFRYIFNSLKLN